MKKQQTVELEQGKYQYKTRQKNFVLPESKGMLTNQKGGDMTKGHRSLSELQMVKAGATRATKQRGY